MLHKTNGRFIKDYKLNGCQPDSEDKLSRKWIDNEPWRVLSPYDWLATSLGCTTTTQITCDTLQLVRDHNEHCRNWGVVCASLSASKRRNRLVRPVGLLYKWHVYHTVMTCVISAQEIIECFRCSEIYNNMFLRHRHNLLVTVLVWRQNQRVEELKKGNLQKKAKKRYMEMSN